MSNPERRSGGGTRRKGRALAMKLLYQVELGGQPLDDVCSRYEEFASAPDKVREFALALARGVVEHKEELDAGIKEALDNWEFDRLAAVDRQLLRVAAYELIHLEDIPARVTINEAIELSREYSTENSAGFVNGVLDNLCGRRAAHKKEDSGRN
jgi:N utilization substance protein B